MIPLLVETVRMVVNCFELAVDIFLQVSNKRFMVFKIEFVRMAYVACGFFSRLLQWLLVLVTSTVGLQLTCRFPVSSIGLLLMFDMALSRLFFLFNSLVVFSALNQIHSVYSGFGYLLCFFEFYELADIYALPRQKQLSKQSIDNGVSCKLPHGDLVVQF